jgi:Ribonuclease T2 family
MARSALHYTVRIGHLFYPPQLLVFQLCYPCSHDVRILEHCTDEPYSAASMTGLEPALDYRMRSINVRHGSLVDDAQVWSHEWTRHGTCTGMQQRQYFLDVLQASGAVDVAAVLGASGLRPSNAAPYTLQQVCLRPHPPHSILPLPVPPAVAIANSITHQHSFN